MRWPLVRITWLDSTNAPSDWHSLMDWQGLGSLECVSVGYVIAEDKRSKTLASHLAYPDEPEDTRACGIMVIPKGAIISLEPLGATTSGRVSRNRAARS